MPAEVTVTTDRLIVYGMVALLLGAVELALLFSRPRSGLGPVERADVPEGEQWMPGGDIFDRERQSSAARVAEEQPAWPVAPLPAPPSALAPSDQPAVHEPWSTGASGPAPGAPGWDKR